MLWLKQSKIPTSLQCGFHDIVIHPPIWRGRFLVLGWPQKIHQLEVDFNNKKHHNKNTRWWFQNIFYFHPNLGKWSILTNIFQRGWNHQLENMFFETFVESLSREVFTSDRLYEGQLPSGTVTGLAWTAMGGSVLYIEPRRDVDNTTPLCCFVAWGVCICHPGKVFMFPPSNGASSKNTPKKTQKIATKKPKKIETSFYFPGKKEVDNFRSLFK